MRFSHHSSSSCRRVFIKSFEMWRKVGYFLVTLVGLSQAACPNPTGTCGNLKLLPQKYVASPCYPATYPDSQSCVWNLTAANNSYYTQFILTTFDIEAWHDYVKFDGPENFIIFYNKTKDKVIITGYPGGIVTADMVTDISKSFKGFNASAIAVSENNLLDQYSTYRNSSLVQVLESPMYVSSSQNPAGGNLNGLDVMFMNIPNTASSPVDVWEEYVGLVSNSTGINIYDVNSTGFKANWSDIDGAESYNLRIFDSRGIIQLTKELSASNLFVNGLPSGSRFNVSVTAINKAGGSRSFSRNAKTEIADPTGLVLTNITQTSVMLHWNAVNGSTNYLVHVTNLSNLTVTEYNVTTPELPIEHLIPGVLYQIEVSAQFEVGKSAVLTEDFSTAPDNVTVYVRKKSTTSITLDWTSVKGAVSYLVTVLENGATLKSDSTVYHNITIEGLSPGKTYNFTVTAENNAGHKGFPSSISDSTALIPDSASVSATDLKPSGFIVRWSNIIGAIRYNLSVVFTSGVVAQSKDVGNVLEYEFDNLQSGTEYELKLFVFTGPDSFRVLTSNRTYSTEVARVPNVQVTSHRQTSFEVIWDLVDGANMYQVQAAGNGKNFKNTTKQNSFKFDGLDYGVAYEVSVNAIFPVGNGPATKLNEMTVPGNVSNISESVTATNAELSWTRARGAESYRINVTKGSDVTTKESSNNQITFPVQPGTSYTVYVEAKNEAGFSSAEKKSFTSDLDPPKNFEIVGVTKNQFTLKWDKPTWNPDNYEYSCTPHNENDEGKVEGDLQSVTINAQPSTKYTCEIQAVTSAKTSAKVSASATTGSLFCEMKPCLNNGQCTETNEKCVCTEAYTGNTCERVKDWCADKTCAPNSLCTNDINQLKAVCKCKEHFDGDPEVRCQAYCKQQTVQNGTLQFNYTFAGATAYSTEQCKEDGQNRALASAVCVSKNDTAGQLVSKFENIEVVSCKLTISNVTIKIDKSSTAVSSKELEKQSAQLQVLTSGEVNEEDVKKVAQYMEDVAAVAQRNKKSVTQDVLVGMVNTADNLIESDSITLEKAPVTQSPGPTAKPTEAPLKKEKEIKQKILKSLTHLAEQVQIPNDTKEIVIETPNIVVKVVNQEESPTGKSEDVPFEPFISDDHSEDGNTTTFKKPLSIKIPGSAIDRAKRDGGMIRISFFLHKDASLFPSAKTSSTEMIIAASLGEDVVLKDLEENIAYHYSNLDSYPNITKLTKFKDNLKSHECAFWDFELGDWSNEGCCLDPHNLTRCLCDHLTNFALLVSDKEIPASVPLEVMSKVGLILSMVGLALTIVIHCIKEDVRKRRPTQILMHICACLFFSYLLFLVGVNSTDNKSACLAIAAILQFLFLASWCWMTVYAYDMYRAFVLVFNTSKTRYMTKCTLFGYGVPLLIAILDAAVAIGYIDGNKKPPGVCYSETGYAHLLDQIPIESSYISENVCWLQGYSLYIGFLLPVGLMLVFNLFVYVMVLKTLTQRKSTVKSSAKKTGMKDNFLISITLSASTGITWISGYIMLLSDAEMYLLITSWIFALLNVIQGIVIFITTCVRHENMRKIWLIPLIGCFSRCCTRISLLSPRRQEFIISTGASNSGYSTTNDTNSTKNTGIKSISSKDISESAI